MRTKTVEALVGDYTLYASTIQQVILLVGIKQMSCLKEFSRCIIPFNSRYSSLV